MPGRSSAAYGRPDYDYYYGSGPDAGPASSMGSEVSYGQNPREQRRRARPQGKPTKPIGGPKAPVVVTKPPVAPPVHKPPVKGPAKPPIVVKPPAKPPVKNPDTGPRPGTPVANAVVRHLSGLHISGDPVQAARERIEVKRRDRNRPDRVDDPEQRGVCKLRPRDNRPKGGGGSGKRFVPWCG